MNKTEESDKRWEGGGKICLKAYQKSGVTVILFTVRGYSKLKRPIESLTVGAGFACPNTQSRLFSGEQILPLLANDSIINILAHSLFGMDIINQPDTAI